MWRLSPFAERYYVETITLRGARLYGDPHSAQSSTVENVEILTGGRAPLCGDPRRTQSCTMWETSVCAERYYMETLTLRGVALCVLDLLCTEPLCTDPLICLARLCVEPRLCAEAAYVLSR
jgi:hypothetical protein